MSTSRLAQSTATPPTRRDAPTPTPRRPTWRRRLGVALGLLALVVAMVLAIGAAWLAVGDSAEEADLALALATHAVTTSDDGEVLTIAPTTNAGPAPAVAFLPGTRIERDAYVATWAPIVEATGATVYVAAVPLNVPVLADDPIGDIIAAHPETQEWVVGGHSMGGFEAAAYAASADVAPAGLLLWASGPGESDLADTEVPTLIVAGAQDTVVPLDRFVDEALLPVDTAIEVIDGMVHGQFGRYSNTEDPADEARRSDADTLADLVDITSAYIDEISTSARQ